MWQHISFAIAFNLLFIKVIRLSVEPRHSVESGQRFNEEPHAALRRACPGGSVTG